MAVTYNGTLDSNLERIRFHIQDTTYGTGPKPGKGNFTDNELNGLVTTEGTWQRAVAAAFAALSALWRRYPALNGNQVTLDTLAIAESYAAQAKEWRRKYGSNIRMGSAVPTRVDAYSSDVTSTE